jgi:DNA/RNA-binding domain of Phe-tRNA-synthetase-like protein
VSTEATTGSERDAPAGISAWLSKVSIDPGVVRLRPDYAAVLLVAEDLSPGPSDGSSDALLSAAEAAARDLLRERRLEDLPEITAWRDAYRSFGAKPKRTRPSVEALLRRVNTGLPRIDRLTDIYNALSVRRLLPVGGEDLARYAGPARLVRATGTEPFDTIHDGQAVTEHPVPGEVVWRDDAGVTCRIWNWRQCRRTRITEQTTAALFILDGLSPLGHDGLAVACQELAGHILDLHRSARLSWRLLGGSGHSPGRLAGQQPRRPAWRC